MREEEGLLPVRRRTLRRLAASAAIGAGGMTALLQAALAANPRPGIRSVKGTVMIDGAPATPGQRIGPGQKVVTQADGEVVFVMGDNAFLQRENSEFAVDAGAGTMVLRYLTGRVLSVFGKGKKTLITPTATIGIRGTACYIEAAPERTYFCLCYGTAVLQPAAAPGTRRTVKTLHHESPFYIGSDPAKPLIERAEVSNHRDSELVMLEELVGRVPPFQGKGYTPY
ncbi:MAG TPA: hypothetical protein VGE12_21715 [Noviherbaspirillum sp.]